MPNSTAQHDDQIANMPHSVALYLVDKTYGGPEEGGWYYQYGILVEDIDIYDKIGFLPRTFKNENAAVSAINNLNTKIAQLNEGRASIGHTNSQGVYELISAPGFLSPKTWPAERPHYE
jgi:hypothetical protein